MAGGDELVDEAAAFFAANLARRTAASPVGVLGAGGDDEDLEAGRRFLALLAPGGWLAPGWPEQCGGRGAPPSVAAAIAQELARYESPDLYPFGVGLSLVGPTVLAHGDDAQQRRWLPAILAGTEIWCQLFSEPDAGSDLAGLTCRAVRDGDEWLVTGQKVWSSRAHYSQRGLLLARTDTTVAKHAGITAFGMDMGVAGVEVRPLRQMNGDAHFNEVFLTEARVDDRDRIGRPGEGWAVAITTLAHERGAIGGGSGGGMGGGAGVAQFLDMVRQRGGATDAVRRQQAAGAVSAMQVARWAARRGVPGAKIRLGTNLRATADLAFGLAGPAAVAGEEHDADEWTTAFLTAPSISIRGGTDEIQRNIIGERTLGLPPEPRVDKGIPFDQLPRSGQRVDRPQ